MVRIIRCLFYSTVLLTVCAVAVTPVMAADEPDLQPTGIEVTTLYAGVSNQVGVVVANNEDVAVGSFNVLLEVDDGSGYVTVDNITGQSILGSGDPWYWPVWVNFSWVPAASGNYTLKATVDSAEAVDESSETNNEIVQEVLVLPSDPITASVRVEGQTGTIWNGDVTFFSSTITDKYGVTYVLEVPTAMGALHAASIAGGFDLVIDSMFGPVDYVESVAGETPVLEPPYPGWMFRANGASSDVGASAYSLADGDEVLWAYTVYGVAPLQVSLDNQQVPSPGDFTVTVESFDDDTSQWQPVPEGVLVYVSTLIYSTDADGKVKNLALNPGSYSVYADAGDYTQYIRSNQETVLVYVPLDLEPGWNFISVPRRLASGFSTAEELFVDGGVDTAGHSIFTYDPSGGWTALGPDDVVSPLDGIWIYSAEDVELHPAFDTNPRQVPPTKQLSAGWNAIGYSDFAAASADSALTSVEDKWTILLGFAAVTQTYEVSIINNAPAGDAHSEDREMDCWKGYWLHVFDACQLAGISS
jgi:hypothetical protein